MKIFVSGATGVIGRRLVPLLVSKGHQVTAIARTPEKAAALSKQGAVPVPVSVYDAEGIRTAVAGSEAVVNVATAIPPSSRALMPGAWKENSRVRTIGSANLVTAALLAGASTFIQESFAPIYADGGDDWLDERSPVKPVRYNHAVMDAEASALRFSEKGEAGIVLRFGMFYGPDSGFTLEAIKMVKKGWAPSLGDADGYMSSLSHDDAASAIVAALELQRGIYNVTDDEPLTRREYHGALARELGVKPPKFLPSWVSHLTGSVGETLARSQRISNSKLKDATGWKPKYPSAREGLAELLRELPAR